MTYVDLVIHFPLNMLVGLGCALFSMLLNVNPKQVGLRNYIFIFVLNLFLTGSIIELFLKNTVWWWCGIAGLIIGWAIDELFLNLETALPEFLSGTIKDILNGVRKKVNEKLGIKQSETQPKGKNHDEN